MGLLRSWREWICCSCCMSIVFCFYVLFDTQKLIWNVEQLQITFVFLKKKLRRKGLKFCVYCWYLERMREKRVFLFIFLVFLFVSKTKRLIFAIDSLHLITLWLYVSNHVCVKSFWQELRHNKKAFHALFLVTLNFATSIPSKTKML